MITEAMNEDQEDPYLMESKHQGWVSFMKVNML